jgi:quinol-cytochrome oxidoreductase complex cytochrome b subunit
MKEKHKNKNFYTVCYIFLSVFIFFLLINSHTNYLFADTQKQEKSYDQNINSKPFYEWQILGTWYLKGYTNASITFKINKDRLSKDVLEINSENIDLFTLNTFPEGSYATRLSYNDFKSFTDYYKVKLINGKIGTLYLTRDNQTLLFLRYKTKNAKEGVFKTNCGCGASLSCGN